MDTMLAFWALHIPAMIVFLGGMGLSLSIWLQGTVNGRRDISARGKLSLLIRNTLAVVFSARLGTLLRVFMWSAVIHPALFREHRLRWTAHSCVFGGIVLLTLLSLLSFISVDILVPIFKLDNLFTSIFANKDHALTAFLNDFGGVVVTLGLIIVMVRRYLTRELELRTRTVDTEIIIFLALIIGSGYVTEVCRLSVEFEELSPTAMYAFLGYPVALVVKVVDLPWGDLHDWAFLFHALFSSAVIAYIPFSKFFHAMAGAVIATVNTFHAEEVRTRHKEVLHEQA